jgi:cell division protein FtsI (penicillin-binding protein 3)
VFSKQTTHRIAELLDAVVSLKGSGYRARIKGYSVAGKTGTAEMVGEKWVSDDCSYLCKGPK